MEKWSAKRDVRRFAKKSRVGTDSKRPVQKGSVGVGGLCARN